MARDPDLVARGLLWVEVPIARVRHDPLRSRWSAATRAVDLVYRQRRRARVVPVDTLVWTGVLFLEQAELPGAGDGLGAALHAQLLEDAAVVALDGVEGEEEPPADLLI